ncbi:hypothetical protein BBP40_004089 [Aspergillus hancockii]|nr:hypothetical protein BBP40_004089 [Aspergillus hancockii]
MGLLDGTNDSALLLGINQVFEYWNLVKAATPILVHLYEILAGNFSPIGSNDGKSPFQKVLDVLLRFYPFGTGGICAHQLCATEYRSPLACVGNYDNLDVHIHENISEFFAGTHTKILEHMTQMGTCGKCLDTQLNQLVTPESLLHL